MGGNGGRRRRGSIWDGVLLAAVVGVALTDVIIDKPELFTPDPASGRVCAALHLIPRWTGPLFYYTTPGGCATSWGFAALGVIAVLSRAAFRASSE